jgi:hypothetical protein
MKALRRTYMDVDILDDNHTVCDSIGVISSDPYTHLMKECGSFKKRLLKRPGTTMLVGSGPFKCDS